MDEVELETFTVTLLKQAPVPGKGPGVPLRAATFEEARRAFRVDLPASLPGGLSRSGIAMGRESQPVLVTDYKSAGEGPRGYLSYILMPKGVYEPAPDGRFRYMIVADSIERRMVGGRVVAVAIQDHRSASQPGSLTAIWEKEGLLALAVADGMSTRDLEAAVRQFA